MKIFAVVQQTQFKKPINSLLISVVKSTENSIFLDKLRDRYPKAKIASKWGNCSIWIQFETVESASNATIEIQSVLEEVFIRDGKE